MTSLLLFRDTFHPLLFAVSLTRNCVTRLVAHLRVAGLNAFMIFIFSRIFRPCPTTVDLTRERVMERGSSTLFSRRRFSLSRLLGRLRDSSLFRLLLEGMRKVKHLTINLTSSGTTNAPQFWWALVYVPQGTTVGTITIGSATAGTANV